MPRGIAFLLNRNRLNVAVSRAKYLSVIVRSPLLTEYLPGTRLVRAFNAINEGPLANQAFAKPERLGIPLAADDPEAMRIAEQLVRDAGFDPVAVGGLARAREFDVGTPVYVRGMTAAELRKALKLK